MGIFSKTSTVNVVIITRGSLTAVTISTSESLKNVVFSFFCFIFSYKCQITDQCLINKASQIENINIFTNYCNLCDRHIS